MAAACGKWRYPAPCAGGRQSPKVAWTSASAATAAVSARRTRGPRLSRTNARDGEDRRPLALIEAAFRPDEETGAGLRLGCGKRRERVGLRRVLVAEDEQAPGRPCGERPVERLRRENVRRPDRAALLAGLDGVGLETFDVEPRHLGAPGDHGSQPSRAHLDRLLRHVVEPCVLQRGEQEVDVGGRLPIPGPPGDGKRRALARGRGERSGEFAVAPVEDQDARSRGQPQDVDKVIRLLGRKRNRGAFGERRRNMEAGAVNFGAGHVRFRGLASRTCAGA